MGKYQKRDVDIQKWREGIAFTEETKYAIGKFAYENILGKWSRK